MMNYKEVLDYIYSRVPMFHKIGAEAYKPNLDNIQKLSNYLGNPHSKYKTIHIAGTNGKGSVSHNIASVLQTAGYKTGLFTSPHLLDFRERIKINGELIPENFVCEFVEKCKNQIQEIQPSFFELTSAMAFSYFAQEQVEIAVIEAGMGGRLDSTNIINPILSVITNISLDHTQFLGDTLEKIAKEKAGIIKNNTPVVIGEDHIQIRKVFLEKASAEKAPIHFADEHFTLDYSYITMDGQLSFDIKKDDQVKYPDLITDLTGNYQQKNILTTLQALEILQKYGLDFKIEQIYSGISQTAKSTGLQGRWQTLAKKPLTICDTGHNLAAFEQIVKQIQQIRFNHLHIVLGFVSDKDVNKILGILPKNAKYYFTNAAIPRAMPAEQLSHLAASYRLQGEAYTSVAQAIVQAQSAANVADFIFIGGSNFVVAETLKQF